MSLFLPKALPNAGKVDFAAFAGRDDPLRIFNNGAQSPRST